MTVLLIVASIIANAKGLAIITVVRVGFLVTARGGSGLVIAKLSDNSKLPINRLLLKSN